MTLRSEFNLAGFDCEVTDEGLVSETSRRWVAVISDPTGYEVFNNLVFSEPDDVAEEVAKGVIHAATGIDLP